MTETKRPCHKNKVGEENLIVIFVLWPPYVHYKMCVQACEHTHAHIHIYHIHVIICKSGIQKDKTG